ncbi:MAG TPA: sigma-70 family RNA polymerase sigma factor [Ktedonobacteraceae bacterium]|nr:sigma-70 family RNA polymerase sigma factor [Ktedonobacteraceae bacterium]
MREHFFSSLPGLDIPLSNAVTSLVELDDQQLVAASKRGDQDAFAQLVQRYQRRIFNLVYRMLQQYEEASETTQEAFLAAWQGLPSFRGEARFATWLYRIAYNCALKQLETRKRDRALQVALQAEQALESVDGQESASAQIDEHERQAFVQEHLSHLPAKYRAVLILRHLQDMTYEEMAEILTMPVGTIKTHLFRARNLLKERLQGLDRDSSMGTRG